MRARRPHLSQPSGPLVRLLLLQIMWLLALCEPAAAQLHLDDSRPRVEAWPQVTTLADPTRQMTLGDVRTAANRFRVPDTAYATLGLSKDPVWLRLPLEVDAHSDGRWILAIDYAVLNRATTSPQ